jgi:hypothetical protein
MEIKTPRTDSEMFDISDCESDDERDVVNADFARSLERSCGELAAALQGLHDDIDDYQRINNLSGHDNHWMVIARATLAKWRGET